MSTAVLPQLVGLAWPIRRTPLWQSEKQYNVSGKEVSKTRWSYPMHQWQLSYGVLRIGIVGGPIYTEMQTLMGFFNARKGAYDTFLYSDHADNSTIAQFIGYTNGTTTSFQLRRSFGAMPLEPVYAPNMNTTPLVYLDGVLQSSSTYVITLWGTVNAAGPGKVVFNTAPAAGKAVQVTFAYYWPCRFAQDLCDFEKMAQGYYRVNQMGFRSLK